ncbi:hypothetical protein D9V32_12640 [Mycetocola tolaasinivorans]|uniref:Uncharacterized protein n=1 Tax=Mycetocola tolaasinivorans TaxID=76635 RepID=A0A3L7A2J6_9MICO|nr:hypothetical protein [Mycetocola tolaasinivorans]RLP74533.1 hypothetical protein D9V32_12640 [Mycetocola tolaasinivorans]
MKLRPRMIALGVGLALVAVGIPTAVTGAALNVSVSATADTAMGSYCTVPDSTVKKNVYSLSDFQQVGDTRMLIVPVVRSAQYLPTEGIEASPGQLGVRLWGCADTLPAGSVKVTAWRSTETPARTDFSVMPAGGNYAVARVNPTSTLGTSLRQLHAGDATVPAGAPAGGPQAAPIPTSTARFSWIVDASRNSGARAGAAAACTGINCVALPSAAAPINTVFSGNAAAPASGAVNANSAVYFAGNYYAPGGTWPNGSNGKPAAPAVRNTVLSTPAAGANPLADTTGNVLQWVVLEWTGATAPSTFEIEVFAG